MSVDELGEKGARTAGRLIAWLEQEHIVEEWVRAYPAAAATTTQPLTGDRQRLDRAAQEILLAMAGFFSARAALQFRRKHLWLFRRPDWEALGAVWEGFAEALAVRLDREHRESLNGLEIAWSVTRFPGAGAGLSSADRLARALDPNRPEDARRAAQTLLLHLERKVNELVDEIFGR